MNNQISTLNKNALDRFSDYAKGHYSSRGSSRNRISAAKKFILFLNEENRSIEEVNHGSVEEFLIKELAGEISLNTVQNYYSYLKGFFCFLKENGDNKIMNFEKVNFERVKHFEIVTFSDSEIAELFEKIEYENNEKTRLSNRIIFKLLLYTGCTLKELDSLIVFQHSSDVIDEDNYITLDTKEIFFRYPIQRKFILHDNLICDIKNYYKNVEKKINRGIPSRSPLLITTYNTKNDKNPIKKFSYGSIQSRMTKVKNSCSFSNKSLSIKNIRQTLICKMIADGKPIDFISDTIGIDISTLKMYIPENEKNSGVSFFYNEHPYLSLFEKI